MPTLHEARAASFWDVCGGDILDFCIFLLQKSTFANIFDHRLEKSEHGVELANKKNDSVNLLLCSSTFCWT